MNDLEKAESLIKCYIPYVQQKYVLEVLKQQKRCNGEEKVVTSNYNCGIIGDDESTDNPSCEYTDCPYVKSLKQINENIRQESVHKTIYQMLKNENDELKKQANADVEKLKSILTEWNNADYSLCDTSYEVGYKACISALQDTLDRMDRREI